MDISAAEWQVMRAVWERQPVGAADVIAALLPETGWSHRTVRTMLARLVEKGALEAAPEGNRYIYRAKVSRARCIRQASRSFLQQVFGGNAEELLLHLVREREITASQIEELKRLLDDTPRKGRDK
jgi:BlaI family penicillinase repressor